MTKFYQYISEAKILSGTMIGLDVSKPSIKRYHDYIESWLERYKIPYEPVKYNHITIAMIKSEARKDDLVRIINSVSTNFTFSFKKYTLLGGRDGGWFLVMKLSKTDDYKTIRNNLKKDYDIVTFPGGISPHISLFRLPPSTEREILMDDKFWNEMIYSSPKPNKIKSNIVQLWSPKFKIDYNKKIRK